MKTVVPRSGFFFKLGLVIFLGVSCLFCYQLAGNLFPVFGGVTVQDELQRLNTLHVNVILPQLGYVPPEEFEGFSDDALVGKEDVSPFGNTIGQFVAPEQTKPALIDELERNTGKTFWSKQDDSPSPKRDQKFPFQFQLRQRSDYVFIPRPDPRVHKLGFPPLGSSPVSFLGQIYYPLQRRFADITIKAVTNDMGVVIYGAALCENVNEENVVLDACVFREIFPVEKGVKDKSQLEYDLAETIRKGLDLEFFPWARYAISYSGCSQGNFRTTFQFGNTNRQKLVTLRVPFSLHAEDALTDLDSQSTRPCVGIDIFLSLEEAVRLLRVVHRARGLAGDEDEFEGRADTNKANLESP